ncbi:hypothetical protein LSAT2_020473 [Lamellibrachia satsuma]|nr:hypothetical protein LSAT2_020473 [Lamellibrachia satsuma]
MPMKHIIATPRIAVGVGDCCVDLYFKNESIPQLVKTTQPQATVSAVAELKAKNYNRRSVARVSSLSQLGDCVTHLE